MAEERFEFELILDGRTIGTYLDETQCKESARAMMLDMEKAQVLDYRSVKIRKTRVVIAWHWIAGKFVEEQDILPA